MPKKIALCAAGAAGLLAAAVIAPALSSAQTDPWLTLSNYTGAPGSTITVNGYGFLPDESVGVSIGGSALSHGTADDSGTFVGTSVSVPSLAPGSYTVLATGDHRDQAQSNFYVTGFYPNAWPSAWYILPGQWLSFGGSGFAPNESVSITGGGSLVNASSTADGSGNLSASNVVQIPFNWQNSTQTFMVKGGGEPPISLTITIGTFYPQINPSTYWVGYNENMSVSGTGFAPGEQVNLSINGTQIAQANADGSGNIDFSFMTPGSGSSFALTAQGASSEQASSRTVSLHS